MYRQILVPVDLAHAETLDKAMATAADLSRHWEAPVTALGVTSSAPTHVANTPENYAKLLARFCHQQGQEYGVTFVPRVAVNPDPVAQLRQALREEVEAAGADLVVMASHVPHFRDWIFSSNANWLVSHTAVSIFVVR